MTMPRQSVPPAGRNLTGRRTLALQRRSPHGTMRLVNDATQIATGRQADPGFWLAEIVLSPEECDQLPAELGDNRLARSRAGARHLMSHLAVRTLATDERLMEIARRGLGGSAVPFRATLFEKSGPSNWLVVWHQDTALPLTDRFDAPDWGPWSEKAGVLYAHAPSWALRRVLALRVHLDDSSLENGPLRVVPKSHELGVLSDEEVFCLARERGRKSCHGGMSAL